MTKYTVGLTPTPGRLKLCWVRDRWVRARARSITGVNVGNNAVAYWGVGNIDDAYERLLDCGAQARNSVKDVGGDDRVASVADPFGNVIGLIQNPHFRVKE